MKSLKFLTKNWLKLIWVVDVKLVGYWMLGCHLIAEAAPEVSWIPFPFSQEKLSTK